MKLGLNVNPHSTSQDRRNAHVSNRMLWCSRFEAAAKAGALRDVRVGTKLSTYCEQWLRQPVSENADINCTFKIEKRDEQSKVRSAYLKSVRFCIVVVLGRNAEEFRQIWLAPLKREIRKWLTPKLSGGGPPSQKCKQDAPSAVR